MCVCSDFALALKRPELDERRRLSSHQHQSMYGHQQHQGMHQNMFSPRDLPSPSSNAALWSSTGSGFGMSPGGPYNYNNPLSQHYQQQQQQKLKSYQQPLMPGSYDSADTRGYRLSTGSMVDPPMPLTASLSSTDLETSLREINVSAGGSHSQKIGHVGGLSTLGGHGNGVAYAAGTTGSFFPPAISSTTAAAVTAAVAVSSSLSSLSTTCMNLVVPPPHPPSDPLSMNNSPVSPFRKSFQTNPDTDPFFGDDSV
jgi:hypothetical protein